MPKRIIDQTSLMEFVLQIFLWEKDEKSLVPIIWKEISQYQPFLFNKFEEEKKDNPENLNAGLKLNYCLIWQYMRKKYLEVKVVVDRIIYQSNCKSNEAFVLNLMNLDSDVAFSNAYYGFTDEYENIVLFYYLYYRIQNNEPFKLLNQQEKINFIIDHLSFIQAFEKYFKRGFGDDLNLEELEMD